MGFLADKKILITGLLSKHSIAYGIAKACHREGAQLAFTYQSERFEDRIKKFAAEFGSDITIPLDVSSDEQIDALFVELGKRWDGLDGLVHSIAYAPTEAIEGDFLNGISREAFRIAHEISSYSYPALARWLTDLGYPTKVSEPRSAKSQKVVLGCVPRTEDVMALLERLQAEFPGAELGRLLAGAGE